MYNFVIFNEAGKIIQKGAVQDKNCVILPIGCSEIEYLKQSEVSFEDDYFDGNAVMKRPNFSAVVSSAQAPADNASEIVISNLPIPTTILIDGESYEVADGKIVLTSDVPAKYKLAADQWPYLPWSIEVEFTEVVK